MKKVIYLLTILLVATSVTGFTLFNSTWNIGNDYNIKFSGKKAEGSFKGLTGTIAFDPSKLSEAKMDVSVSTSSINTGNSTKDKHARSDSWFDATKYPTIHFVSKSFTKQASTYVIDGVLTLHGVSKNITIPFTFNQTNNSAIFTGSFKINRKDYGIKGNMFGFMVGDEFTVDLQVPVTLKQ